MSSVKFLGRVSSTCASIGGADIGQCHRPGVTEPLRAAPGTLAQVKRLLAAEKGQRIGSSRDLGTRRGRQLLQVLEGRPSSFAQDVQLDPGPSMACSRNGVVKAGPGVGHPRPAPVVVENADRSAAAKTKETPAAGDLTPPGAPGQPSTTIHAATTFDAERC